MKIEAYSLLLFKLLKAAGFDYTLEKVEQIEKIFLPKLGKGQYREILNKNSWVWFK